MTNDTSNSDQPPVSPRNLADNRQSTFRISRIGVGDKLPQRQNSLLELLELLHRERLEPAAWIALYAKEERGSYRRRLKRFANRLAKGTPWVDALEQTPDVLSDDQVLALRLASQSGTLVPTFESLRHSESSADRLSSTSWTYLLVYWCAVGIILILAMIFFASFISPFYRQYHREMELPLRSDSLVQEARMTWAIAIGSGLIGLLAFGIIMGWSASVRRWIRSQWIGGWFKPTLATTSAAVFRMLSTSAREGRPVVGALSTLAKYHSDSRLQQQLLLARNEIEQGASDWESMRISGLLTEPERQALEICPENVSQAWILEQFASKRELESQRRRAIIQQCVHPILVLIFGTIVLWLAISTLGPIYSSISSLSL